KNRINRVHEGGFYGNMFGFTSVTDSADSAMEPPMVWITNAKDRSPAELVWVPKNTWGSLGGSLLNLSYGTGRIFIVPHEQVGRRVLAEPSTQPPVGRRVPAEPRTEPQWQGA